MPANQGPPSNMPVPRPLPSVDIPLLAHERRQRIRMAWIGPALALAVGLVVGGGWALKQSLSGANHEEQASSGALNSPIERIPEQTAAAIRPPATGERPQSDGTASQGWQATSEPASKIEVTRTTAFFGKAKGFQQAMMQAGVAAPDAEALVKGMTPVLDFRRCRPEDQLVFERDGQGTLHAFEYHLSPVRIYRAERKANGAFFARQQDIKLDTIRIVRGGKVQVSLGDALEAVGLRRDLVGVFVQVFEQQFNFSTDTRQGDTFRIIVDEERLKGAFWRYGTAHAIEYNSQKQGIMRAYWFEAIAGEPEYFSEDGRAIQGGWMRTPLRYEYISSGFSESRFHPVVKRSMPHHGIDYVAATGLAVWSAADGRVTFVGQKGPNGNLVIVRHSNGYQSYYAHLSRFASGIKAGKRVKQREVLGYVGSTGRSTGPHLHFGLKRGARFLNPLKVLNTPGPPLAGKNAQRFRAHAQSMQRQLERIPI